MINRDPGKAWRDGYTSNFYDLAKNVTDPVLPHRRCFTFDDTHSIFVSNAAGLDWKTALTWNPAVLETVHQAIEDAPKGMESANRQDCPVS